MVKEFLSKIIKEFDYFGVQFNFNYSNEEKYRTTVGGLGFLLFIAVGVAYAIITGIPMLKRQKMSVIYYTMQLPDTDEINLLTYKNNFALGVSSCNKLKDYSEFWDYFKLTLTHVVFLKENGQSNRVTTPIEIEKCTYENFNNEFNETFDTVGLDNYYCLKDRNFTIQGIYSDPIFQYIQIALQAKDETEELFEKIKVILSEECDFNMYIMDAAFDLSNYKKPIHRFLLSQYINLKFPELMKRNTYFRLQQFDSYENYLFDTHETLYTIGAGTNDLYSVTKGEDRQVTKKSDYQTFAKIYLRAGQQRNIIERRYQKITEYAANISSLLSVVLIIMFVILNFINRFYANEAVMTKIFQFDGYKNNTRKANSNKSPSMKMKKTGLSLADPIKFNSKFIFKSFRQPD